MDSNEIHQFGHSLHLRGEGGVKIGVGDGTDGDFFDVMIFEPLAMSGSGRDRPGQSCMSKAPLIASYCSKTLLITVSRALHLETKVTAATLCLFSKSQA